MRTRIGLSIGARDVHAAWIESGAVRWHRSVSLESAERVDEVLRALLGDAPRTLMRVRVTVVLSPAWVQVRPLCGLPPVESRRAANQLLRQNQQAFFLWKGQPGVLPDIHVDSTGAAWGAAFDADMLESLVRALRARRMSLGQIAPAVSALAAVVPDCRFWWSEGADLFELETSRRELRRVRRTGNTAGIETAPLPESLRTLGGDAGQYLAAYAAAVAPRRLPLGWRPRADATCLRRWKRGARFAASIALLASVMFAFVAPGIRAARYAAEWKHELNRSRAAQTELARVQADLRRVTDALDRIAAHGAGRGGITRTVASLSRSLPESTAILTIHLDSANGSFTAISPHVTDVLPALDDTETIVAPRIMGSVTRDVIAGATLERAAFRFRRPRIARQALR